MTPSASACPITTGLTTLQLDISLLLHSLPRQAGVTLDSGIAERCKTLYALLEPAANVAANPATRILQVSYPVPVAPLNPWRGYSVPSTSPYKNTPLAIPHFSAGGLDFLIEDFQTSFLRRMGVVAPNAAGVAAYGGAENAGALAIEFVADSAELELKYFRLAHTRALKESYRFNVWQAQTFLGPRPPSVAEDGHDANGRMIAVGKDQATSANNAGHQFCAVPRDGQNVGVSVLNDQPRPGAVLFADKRPANEQRVLQHRCYRQ